MFHTLIEPSFDAVMIRSESGVKLNHVTALWKEITHEKLTKIFKAKATVYKK